MNAASYIQTGNISTSHKLGSPLLDGLKKLNNYLLESDLRAENKKEKLIQNELQSVGFSRFQLDRRESRHIAAYLNEGEHIRAGVRGRISDAGRVVIIATDSRILYLHDIPLYSSFEEFAYDVVSEVMINRAGYLSSVTLSTKFKIYQIDCINPRQAEKFFNFVDSQVHNHELQFTKHVDREVLMR